MKKYYCYLIKSVFLLSTCFILSCNNDDDNGEIKGEGTSDSPYIIKNATSLLNLAELINEGSGNYSTAKYKLTSDVDLANWGGSSGWTPIGNEKNPFKGEFDGNGYTIKNLSITKSESSYYGLFGRSTGKIKNVKLTNVNITGAGYIGGIAGWSNGIIEQCSVEGTIKANSTIHNSVGGLVGYSGSSVSNCYTAGNVSGVGGSHALSMRIGGLIGYTDGSIRNCYSSATVSVTNSGDYNYAFIGGLVGSVSTVYSSFAANKTVSGSGSKIQAGKVAGTFSSLRNCFASKTMSVTGYTQPYLWDGLRITEIPLSEMYTENFYSNTLEWDMEKIWVIQKEGEFPVLR